MSPHQLNNMKGIRIPKSWILLAVFIVSVVGAGAWVFTTPPDYTTNQTGDWFGNTSNNGNNYTADRFNVMNYFGTVIGSYVDSYTCDGSYCIYHPWYASGQIYAKNVTTGKIDFSGTDAYTVTQYAVTNISNGTISFGCGNYLYTHYVNISSKVTLDGKNCAVMKLNGASEVFNVTSDYVQVRNFEFNGNSKAGDGIRISRGYSIEVDNNNFTDANRGINIETIFNNSLVDAVQDTDISHNVFWLNNIGVRILTNNSWGWATEIIIHKNYFRLQGDASIYPAGRGVEWGWGNQSDSGVRVMSNTIEVYSGVKTNTVALNVGTNGFYSTVYDNRIENLYDAIFNNGTTNNQYFNNMFLTTTHLLNGTYPQSTTAYNNIGSPPYDYGNQAKAPSSHFGEGDHFYNTTSDDYCWYKGTRWANATGVGSPNGVC